MNNWPHLCRLQAKAERQRRRCDGHDAGRRRAQIPKERSDIAAAAQVVFQWSRCRDAQQTTDHGSWTYLSCCGMLQQPAMSPLSPAMGLLVSQLLQYPQVISSASMQLSVSACCAPWTSPFQRASVHIRLVMRCMLANAANNTITHEGGPRCLLRRFRRLEHAFKACSASSLQLPSKASHIKRRPFLGRRDRRLERQFGRSPPNKAADACKTAKTSSCVHQPDR